MKTYHVRVSSASISGHPSPYLHVAVMRHREGPTEDHPYAIRNTKKWEVVMDWGRCHLGWKPKGNTAGQRAIREAEAYVAKLEKEEENRP